LHNKGLVIGILILLLGVNIGSSFAGDVDVKTMSSVGFDGNTLYVGGNGPNNYTKIQDAINDSSDGDTVFVYSGFYYEKMIKVDKSINLIGEDKNSTCIDGQNYNGIIILVTSSDVIISDFLLRNGYYHDGFGQAIYLWGNNTSIQNIHISDCIITNSDKGVFSINVRNVFIKNCHIHNIRGPTTWGYEGISNVIISNCVAHNNGVNLGGGWIREGSFSFDSYYSDISIFDSNIHDIIGSGISFHYGGDKVDIFQNNIYQNYGDGIRFYCDPSDIKNININNNHIYKNYINGLFLSGLEYPGIEIYSNNISFNGHEETFRDGGIYLQVCDNYTVNINNNIISSNNGAGIYPNGNAGIEIIENEIIKNTKEGIHLHASEDAIIQGNNIIENKIGIYLDWCYSTVSGNLISDNEIGINISSSNNVIYNNEISNNDEGIKLQGSQRSTQDNNISYNNFLKNKKDAFFRFSNPYYLPIPIIFNQNYWNRQRIFPKPIFGILELNRFNFNIPWVCFDWHPAQNPYTINQDYYKIQNTKQPFNSEECENSDKSWIEQDIISYGNSPPLFVNKVKIFQQEPYDI